MSLTYLCDAARAIGVLFRPSSFVALLSHGESHGPNANERRHLSAPGTQQPPCQTKDYRLRHCFNEFIYRMGYIDARPGTRLGQKLLPGRGKLCRVGHHICRVAQICRIAGLGGRGRGRAPVTESARLRCTGRVLTSGHELLNVIFIKIDEQIS